MSDELNQPGKIHISPTAIASIGCQAVLKVYGVMGMASRNAVDNIADAITHDPNHGIRVSLEGNQITIDVYVILAYGTRISEVADSIIEAVRFEVEKSVGVPVHQVNVYVQDLLMNGAD